MACPSYETAYLGRRWDPLGRSNYSPMSILKPHLSCTFAPHPGRHSNSIGAAELIVRSRSFYFPLRFPPFRSLIVSRQTSSSQSSFADADRCSFRRHLVSDLGYPMPVKRRILGSDRRSPLLFQIALLHGMSSFNGECNRALQPFDTSLISLRLHPVRHR